MLRPSQMIHMVNNKYRIEKIDPTIYTDEDWQRYYDFRYKSYALINEPMPFDSVAQLKALNVSNIKNSGDELHIVWKNEQENGMLFFAVDCKDDPDRRFTYLENYLNDRTLDEPLLKLIFQRFIDYDAASNSLAILSRDGMNDFVEKLYGATVGANAVRYELPIKDAKEEVIAGWLAEGATKFSDLRMEFYDEIPDELLEKYGSFYRRILDDIPVPTDLGDNTFSAESAKSLQEAFKLRNYCIYNYLLFNEANELMALTNVNINLKDRTEIEQGITGVRKDYRGRGLSKWLKAAMYKKLITDFPELETIETETHPLNHPSRELSKQMGFKETGTQKYYLISREAVLECLGAEQ
ncbi:GNAT family N-acetyltransferase [Chitinophagales bacterium]|nr:GNAT family N-acetyltransferase [Chitinophagales bacterium]